MVNKSSVSGYTLVEIIIVLLLLGIISAFLVIRAADFIEVSEESGGIKIVKGHLRYAKIKSMTSNGVWGVIFQTDSYKLYKYNAVDKSLAFYKFPGEGGNAVTKPDSLDYSGYIAFDKWGKPCKDKGCLSPSAGMIKIGDIIITNETGYIP